MLVRSTFHLSKKSLRAYSQVRGVRVKLNALRHRMLASSGRESLPPELRVLYMRLYNATTTLIGALCFPLTGKQPSPHLRLICPPPPPHVLSKGTQLLWLVNGIPERSEDTLPQLFVPVAQAPTDDLTAVETYSLFEHMVGRFSEMAAAAGLFDVRRAYTKRSVGMSAAASKRATQRRYRERHRRMVAEVTRDSGGQVPDVEVTRLLKRREAAKRYRDKRRETRRAERERLGLPPPRRGRPPRSVGG